MSRRAGSYLPEDEQLISRVRQGDAEALESLYDRYAAAIMGLAMRILGETAAAEEITQETFWRAWQNAAAFDAGKGSLPAWLFSIARNLAIDTLRRRASRPQPALEMGDEPVIERVSDPESDVAELAWSAIQREHIRKALALLPEAQRMVIEMAYFGGLTRQEIAAATGEPLGTVHTRARLALKKLSETLLAFGIEG